MILDAAERLFRAKGLHAATMEEVAAEAGLGKGTIYLYFRTKDDLRLGVATRHQARLLQKMAVAHADAVSGLDELRRLLLEYARHLSASFEHLRMVMACWVMGPSVSQESAEAGEHLTHIRRTFSMLSNAVARGRADGSIRPGETASHVALQLWSFVNGALLFRLQRHYLGAPKPLRQLDPALVEPTLEEAIDMCLDAVRFRDDAVPASEPSVDSTGAPPRVEDGDAEPEPRSEPRAAAGPAHGEGGVRW